MARTFKTRGLGQQMFKAQKDTDKSFEAIVPDWIRNGKLIKNIDINPVDFRRVTHGLPHHHQGWLLLSPRNTGGAMVNEVTNLRDNKAIVLRASNSITIDIWIW